jgi:protease-4
MDEATVREIADGRFYTGRQALALNLIDELGDLDEAVAKAAALGGITGEPRRIEYEPIPSFSDFFMGMSQQSQLSETDLLLQTIQKLSSPVMEYRFTGQ